MSFLSLTVLKLVDLKLSVLFFLVRIIGSKLVFFVKLFPKDRQFLFSGGGLFWSMIFGMEFALAGLYGNEFEFLS